MQESESILRFETIDLASTRELCIQYRRDSYLCSFTDGDKRFAEENGEDGSGYVDWLERRIDELPQGCVHAWRCDSIVGQIESRLRDDGSGYVNLFYLAPHARGCGLGRQLNRYSIELFDSLGAATVRLTVSANNKAALGFYRRMGWREIGPRPGRQDALLFEYAVDSAEGLVT